MVETYDYYLNKYGFGLHEITSNSSMLINSYYVSFRLENCITHNAKIHRLDGPAVISKNDSVRHWWINGRCVDEEIGQWAEEQNINLDNLTDDDKVMIKLSWGDYRGDI